jgi:UDP-glucose-4-epimerase GalE
LRWISNKSRAGPGVVGTTAGIGHADVRRFREENQSPLVVQREQPAFRGAIMTRNVLVAGGAGYIGSHAAKALAKAGYRPIAYDNLCRGHADAVRWGPLVEGNIGDRAQVIAAIRRYDVGAVMDFAGYAYVGESMARPGLYYHNNLSNSLALLDAVREAGVGHFVFSSSCAVYGDPQSLPIRESDPLAPISPYGDSKLAFERALQWHGKLSDLRYVALRYFNAAGCDPEGEIGCDHDPETRIVPLVIKAALGIRARIDIYGTDYATADGTAVRDFVHVQDLADAHVRALQYLEGGGANIALNLATGRGYSVREIVSAVERLCGRRVPWSAQPRREGDPPELYADAGLARRLLGWEPRLSDLDTIIRTAWAWYEDEAALPQVASV